MTDFPHRKSPCAECPWRTDVPLGKFTPARFRALAPTAYDMARSIFACHMAKDAKPFACAGFLLRSARHNLTVRMAIAREAFKMDVVDGGHALFPTYRAMAIANGVKKRDPALANCRADGAM